MRGLRFIPANINISFIPRRIMFFIFSAVLITSSVGLFLTKGLNYGIDFQGCGILEVDEANTGAGVAWERGCRDGRVGPSRGLPLDFFGTFL